MSVLLIIGPKCTLAASCRWPLVSHVEYTPMGQTDGRTDARPLRCAFSVISLSRCRTSIASQRSERIRFDELLVDCDIVATTAYFLYRVTGNYLLDEVQIPQGECAILGVVRSNEKHWESLLGCTQNG